MSTPIKNLETNENSIDQQNNSELVQEILKEMNNNNSEIQNTDTNAENFNNQLYLEQQQQQQQQEQFNHQMDNILPPNISESQARGPFEQNSLHNIINTQRPNINIEEKMDVPKTFKDTIIDKGKEPFIIAMIALSVSSPIMSNLLNKYIPILFSNSASSTMTWLGLVIKALLIGILFFIYRSLQN